MNTLRRLADALDVSARLVPLYLLALILDWQDRKAGAR